MAKELKERGIMFRGELVQEILGDVKLVTRRMSKSWLNVKKGRKLYVRETWRVVGWHEDEPLFIEFKDGKCIEESVIDSMDDFEEWDNRMREQCSDDCVRAMLELGPDDLYTFKNGIAPTRWRPSIHMPRGCSRIDLEATDDARLEHLLDITEEDAKLEGVRLPVSKNGDKLLLVSAPHGMREWTFREAFLCLWSQMHRKKGERVEDNPEVVRIPFRRINGR